MDKTTQQITHLPKKQPKQFELIKKSQHYLTTAQTAILLGVTIQQVQEWCRDDLIAGVLKPGQGYLIPRLWVQPNQLEWTEMRLDRNDMRTRF